MKDKSMILEYWKNGDPGTASNNEGRAGEPLKRTEVTHPGSWGDQGSGCSGALGRGGKKRTKLNKLLNLKQVEIRENGEETFESWARVRAELIAHLQIWF